MDSAIVTADLLLQQTASLLLYQSVLESEVGHAFLQLLQTIHQAQPDSEDDRRDCLQWYGQWFKALATCNQSWQDYLMLRLLRDDNPFTRQVQRLELAQLPIALVNAVQHDLQVLQQLCQCDSHDLSQWVMAATQGAITPVVWQAEASAAIPDWLRSAMQSQQDPAGWLMILASYYRQQGTGLFADYEALRWQAGTLVGIAYPDPIQVSNLAGYELQKAALLKNTEFLLQGYPALHVLLYGSRGSGKSSLVKGLLHQYADRGLRLIEVAKSDLCDLPTIVDQVHDRPQKFILFVDDLSFEEDDEAYKALKVVLEGNLTARPQNVVVYATSNRRHLIREFFGDRPRPQDADEIHNWDTVQEKLSFSDRFGLTLTFEPADQPTYLQIVHHLAQQAEITLDPADLDYQALQWATRHNGRSGRTARQFVDFLQAELAISTQPFNSGSH
ncbi:ATP-binding protein [Pantanalinema rosaneae CENA516]|uniref:ATP-binding protein n=1 Tax=Pantanalinema rosaneae TaxID=1620701 RepID=UPI003D6F6065